VLRAERTDEVLYVRASDPDPFVHVTHRAAPGFAAVAFEAASLADLEALAKLESAAVDRPEGPGGSAVVQLTDPSGFRVEVVAGRAPAARISVARPPLADSAFQTPRLNSVKRVAKGPSHLKRLGHCVLNANDFRKSGARHKSRFGLITSNEISLDGMGPPLGAFLRRDRGPIPSDHHTLFLIGSGQPKFNHAAFEVADFDDLMCGSDWLRAKFRI